MIFLEHELSHQIKQKDGYIDEIRKDMDEQLCQIQLENVSLHKSKQQIELEMKRITIDLENTAQASISERKRLEEEIVGLRSRLDSTQNRLTSAREEALVLAEAKAGIERELNLVRGQCGIPAMPNLDYFPAKERIKEENVPSSVNLRELCNKQTRIIDELKSQCLMATDKLESLSKKYQTEKAQYEYSLAVLTRQNGSQGLKVFNENIHLKNSPKDDNTAVIEWLCRQLGSIFSHLKK